MNQAFSIQIDRDARASIADQIAGAIGAAIRDGRLAPGARLPSWRDLAAQLGVARGTVRVAYENLRDLQVIVSAGAAGTRVAPVTPAAHDASQAPARARAQPLAGQPARPAAFQIGVPAQDVFPFKTWSRIMGRAARKAAAAPVGYPDPCGEPELRSEIAAYLCIARGIHCAPSQVFITNGFTGALLLALRALRMEGKSAWMEEPGFTLTRETLLQSGVTPVPVPVDPEGLDVAAGAAVAPHAALAVVTPGQQAPLGVTLSLRRRRALLDWAQAAQAWIIEDDYLGELQLQGRATPALASLDDAGRVLHIGTFSKTINPALRVAFMVVPAELAGHVAGIAPSCAAAPTPSIQFAIAEFMRDGHYLRHLRRMKRLYADRRRALAERLRAMDLPHVEAALAVLLRLPDGLRDTGVAELARAAGMAPSALSWWYAQDPAPYHGLLLGVTNATEPVIDQYCKHLALLCKG